MRDYVKRLLAERFEVTAVGDGQAALTAIGAERPELVPQRRHDAEARWTRPAARLCVQDPGVQARFR